MGELDGRIALVTGAARHLGRGVALGLAARGCDVAVHYRTSRREAREAARRIESLGRRAVAVQADVTDPAQVVSLVARVTRKLGAPDILVNNVGDYRRATVEATSPEDWDAVFRSNVTSAFLVSREVARAMAGRGGRIIQIGFASTSILRARPGLTAYAAAKAALASFSRSFAMEVAASGITVNVVNVGYFEHEDTTDAERALAARVPLGRLGTVDDLAAVVAFLAGDGASYLTGNILELSGGFGI